MAKRPIRPAGHAGTQENSQGQDSAAADRLFAELDNRAISGARDGWVAQVNGVHMVGAEAWVQVASANEPLCNVLLHLSSRATAHHALAALQAWTGTPLAERDSTVHVMRIA